MAWSKPAPVGSGGRNEPQQVIQGTESVTPQAHNKRVTNSLLRLTSLYFVKYQVIASWKAACLKKAGTQPSKYCEQ